MPRVSRNRRRALPRSRRGFLRIPRRESEKIQGTRFNSVRFGTLASGALGVLGAEESKRVASRMIEWCYPHIPGAEKDALRKEITAQIETSAVETARAGQMVKSGGRSVAGDERGEQAEVGGAAQAVMGWLARSDPALSAKPRGFFGGLNIPKVARDYFMLRAREERRGTLRVSARDREYAKRKIELLKQEAEAGKAKNNAPAIWSFELEKELDFPGAGMRFVYHLGMGRSLVEADALVREEAREQGRKGKRKKKK